MNRSGAGWVRWVIVLEVLALLAMLAWPAVREASLDRRSQGVADDVRLVLAAANQARETLGSWPDDDAPGRVPPALARFLPRGFAFENDGYSLDWDHWKLSDGAESFSKRSGFLAVSVTVRDPAVAGRVATLLGGEPMRFTVGSRSTFPISDPRLPTP